MSRGALVIVEGLDRSGKSTQCRLLGQRLNELGHKTKLLRFPGLLKFCLFFVRLCIKNYSVFASQKRLKTN